MSRLIVTALLWIAAIGCGVMAGVYFTFSAVIMPALERIGPAPGTLTMNSVNVTILGSLFMPLFYATTLASLALAVISLAHWRDPAAITLAAAGILYVLGMFGVTVVFNVPLNNALMAVEPGSSTTAGVWAHYLKDWTVWNHVRTCASLVAAILFVVALRTRA